MSYMHPGTMPAKKKSRAGLIIGLVVAGVLAVCGFGVLVAAVAPDTGNSAEHGERNVVAIPDPAPIAPPSVRAAPKKTAKPAPAPVQIDGSDVVEVGTDVPAGTYRAQSPVSGSRCYWQKSSDAEGTDIIANGLPTGGRPQVTLEKGQWFTSARCPNWVKK